MVGDGEPEWLPEDLDALLAWQQWTDDLCSGCGHPKSESMAPGADNAYIGEPVQCHACRAAQRSTDDWSHDDLKGIYVTARRDDDG